MVLKTSQIREMTDDELRQKTEALRKEIFELVTQAKSGRAEKPHRISQAKKELARVITILNEKKIQGNKSNDTGKKTD